MGLALLGFERPCITPDATGFDDLMPAGMAGAALYPVSRAGAFVMGALLTVDGGIATTE